jgi:hypothetical protein
VLKLSSLVSDVFPKVLKLSSEVDECKPLVEGMSGEIFVTEFLRFGLPSTGFGSGLWPWQYPLHKILVQLKLRTTRVFRCVLPGRGLHSFAFRLNVSAFCGIGGALRICSGVILRVFTRFCGVLGGVGGWWGEKGRISCQIWFRLS